MRASATRQVLLPTQLAADGSLPLELKRTKPYGYALFDLEALAALCEILSTPGDDLWTYTTPDGRGIARPWPGWSPTSATSRAGRCRRT
jgi:hypothetical protein